MYVQSHLTSCGLTSGMVLLPWHSYHLNSILCSIVVLQFETIMKLI